MGSTWPPSRIAVAGRIMPGDASPLVAFLARPRQTSPAVLVHPAGRDFGHVAEVGPEARGTEGARQGDPIVKGGPDGGMAPCCFVGRTPGQEELPAAGGVGGMSVATHPPERQETQQHEMDQGDDQLLDQSTRLLKRNAADEVRPGLLQNKPRFAPGRRGPTGRRHRGTRAADGERPVPGSSRRIACHTSPRGEVVLAGDGHGGLAPRWLRRHRPWRLRSDRPAPRLQTRRPGWRGPPAQRRRLCVSSLRAGISTESAGTVRILPLTRCREAADDTLAGWRETGARGWRRGRGQPQPGRSSIMTNLPAREALP